VIAALGLAEDRRGQRVVVVSTYDLREAVGAGAIRRIAAAKVAVERKTPEAHDRRLTIAPLAADLDAIELSSKDLVLGGSTDPVNLPPVGWYS
jgi:hypothetical protein